MLQLLFLLLTKTIYRFCLRGLENLPKKGPTLLVANHVSLIDAFFLLATVQRPIHFIMGTGYLKKPWVKLLSKFLKIIPISQYLPASKILKSLKRARDLLDHGEIICIFPESQLGDKGTIEAFQRNIDLLRRGKKIPIIPVYFDYVWGSIFSYEQGNYFAKLPKHFPYHITIAFGAALDDGSTAGEIRQAIIQLGTETWIARRPQSKAIHHRFLQETKRNPFCTCLLDKGNKLSRMEVLTGAIALARKLFNDQEKNVGILLPATIAAVLSNLAASLAGRVSVNLNFTTGQAQQQSAIDQAQLKTIITSREFAEKISLKLPEGIKIIYLEDIKPLIGRKEKLKCLLAGLLLPQRLLEKFCGALAHPQGNDLLTVIFTSGSTGHPKGVMLSHFNVDSNVEGVAQVTPITGKHDRLLLCLPLFHSFGYMTMWLGLSSNLELVMHPNPLDAQTIGELIHDYRVGIVFTTPTFLRSYMRKIRPNQLRTVKCMLTGGEKLPRSLTEEFEHDFNIPVIEGYGATECSPVIASNTTHIHSEGIFQPGAKAGTVGQSIPGVSVRIVDPETYEELPQGWTGLLEVRGPNVMMGYLNEEELSATTIREGWYNTGDIACIDAEGYITITDRISRFSKIGGEMVPHGKVEEALHHAADATELIFAVTGVPDKKKGEKLAVLHTCSIQEINPLLDKLKEQGLPNLFIPHPSHFIKVEALPILGNGKLDLKALKVLAHEKLGNVGVLQSATAFLTQRRKGAKT